VLLTEPGGGHRHDVVVGVGARADDWRIADPPRALGDAAAGGRPGGQVAVRVERDGADGAPQLRVVRILLPGIIVFLTKLRPGSSAAAESSAFFRFLKQVTGFWLPPWCTKTTSVTAGSGCLITSWLPS
jgi:hypothetical protein